MSTVVDNAPARSPVRSYAAVKLGVLVLAIAAAAVFAAFAKRSEVYLMTLYCVYLMATMGLNLTVGYAGQMSLGQAAFLGIGAYIAAIIGGFNQTRGALLGGVLIGVLENLVGFYFSPAYKEGVALMLFLVVILFRPEGLLGKAEERKV